MIPISDAQDIGEKRDLCQVIILGWNGQETFITTWGNSDTDGSSAAQIANTLKKQWNWPDYTITESAKIQKLHERIAELEMQLGKISYAQPSWGWYYP
jgi:hypothetical protein